jgi:uncharacterized repeat protein (TIGR03803 family)
MQPIRSGDCKALTASCLALLLLFLVQSAHASGFKVLYDFSALDDGDSPLAGLVRGTQHDLYGTTEYGGEHRSGTVFKLTPDGTETILHSFANGDDGATPQAGLVIDKLGSLYGTTLIGGANGQGAIFEVSANGTETVLHSFAQNDGTNPVAGLLIDRKGNLYGTTPIGGTDGGGTVFKLAPDGKFKVLHSFESGPTAALISDASHNLYGTTEGGGTCGNNGTIFKLAQDGTFTTLYSFCGGPDGGFPDARLLRDSSGNLIGTTTTDSGACGCGTIFQLSTDGTFSVLHTFEGSDGAAPEGGVVQDANGNLYGTTVFGGADYYYGTIYKLAPDGTEIVLHSFTSGDDGANPRGELILDKKGHLYGTASSGGATSYGTVYKLDS